MWFHRREATQIGDLLLASAEEQKERSSKPQDREYKGKYRHKEI
jgi:hypothetical protein